MVAGDEKGKRAQAKDVLRWGLRISSDTCWAEAGLGHRMEGGSKPGECVSRGLGVRMGHREEAGESGEGCRQERV